ncbi:hypothetical protein O6P43_021882 [Quillaja saponaria]|uniref:Uncharacterized protein n=1 Tax=Quillaja saponaria TaxID=32244 RepID=A0AAD7PHM3_QUISA|nr:hypothetical protein O6P43_021882 [Quillaja saponaria]
MVLRPHEHIVVSSIVKTNKSMVRVEEKTTEDSWNEVGVGELENEASATDAELQSVRCRTFGGEVEIDGPLNSEADDQPALEALVVEKGVREPLTYDESRGSDRDGDSSSGEIHGVDTMVWLTLADCDFRHWFCTLFQRSLWASTVLNKDSCASGCT